MDGGIFICSFIWDSFGDWKVDSRHQLDQRRCSTIHCQKFIEEKCDYNSSGLMAPDFNQAAVNC